MKYYWAVTLFFFDLFFGSACICLRAYTLIAFQDKDAILLIRLHAWVWGKSITLAFDSRSRIVALTWKNKNSQKGLKDRSDEIYNFNLLEWFLFHSSICFFANHLPVGLNPDSISTTNLNTYKSLKFQIEPFYEDKETNIPIKYCHEMQNFSLK